MRIIRLHEQHVRAVADLHCTCLGGLLTRLGRPTARLYYAGCVGHPLASGWVAVDDMAVGGFVLGSARPAALRRDLARWRPLTMAATLALAVIRRPRTLVWLSSGLRGPEARDYDGTCPELTYLAVAPAHRGEHLGQTLVETFTRAMRAAGQSGYQLSVDETNRGAIAFYERLGFTRVGHYREFGAGYLRYRLETGHPREDQLG